MKTRARKLIERANHEAELLGLPLLVTKARALPPKDGYIRVIVAVTMAEPSDPDITIVAELDLEALAAFIAGMQLARCGRTRSLPWKELA